MNYDIVQDALNASGIDFASNTDEMDVDNAEADFDLATATASQSADLPFVGQQHTLTTVVQNDNVFNVANGESVEWVIVKVRTFK